MPFYEQDFQDLDEVRRMIYSARVVEYCDDFNCFKQPLVNKVRLSNRSLLHKRSYLDFKLRLSDHLLADHGDRMAMARGIEVRYPYLDRELIEWARSVPADVMLKNGSAKYILRKLATRFLPGEIVVRSKFGFHSPGSPQLLKLNKDWINDLLSYERIKRQGYFNPESVEILKRRYLGPDFRLNLPFEYDLLTVVMTFSIFLDVFSLPNFN